MQTIKRKILKIRFESKSLGFNLVVIIKESERSNFLENGERFSIKSNILSTP